MKKHLNRLDILYYQYQENILNKILVNIKLQ